MDKLTSKIRRQQSMSQFYNNRPRGAGKASKRHSGKVIRRIAKYEIEEQINEMKELRQMVKAVHCEECKNFLYEEIGQKINCKCQLGHKLRFYYPRNYCLNYEDYAGYKKRCVDFDEIDKISEIDTIRIEITEVNELLSQAEKLDDPIGKVQYAHKKQELETKLKQLEETK